MLLQNKHCNYTVKVWDKTVFCSLSQLNFYSIKFHNVIVVMHSIVQNCNLNWIRSCLLSSKARETILSSARTHKTICHTQGLTYTHTRTHTHRQTHIDTYIQTHTCKTLCHTQTNTDTHTNTRTQNYMSHNPNRICVWTNTSFMRLYMCACVWTTYIPLSFFPFVR